MPSVSMAVRAAAGAVVLGLVVSSALANEGEAQSSEGRQERVLRLADDCGACELVVRQRVAFKGSEGDLAWIERLMNVAMDSRGRYWFAFGGVAPLVNVVAADGRFLGAVGRRGQGPGEFESADAVVPVDDSVWIFDTALQRASVAGPDLSPGRSFRFQGQVFSGVSVGWPRVILNADVPTPGGVGRAYHVLNVATGAIESSFGGLENYSRREQRRLIGHLALDPASGVLWTISRATFHLQKWTLDGKLRETLAAPEDWFPSQGTGSLGSPTRPPDPVTMALRVVEAGVLVFFETPIPDWRTAWPRRTAARPGHPLPAEMPSVPLRRPKAALVDARMGTIARVWEHDVRPAGLGSSSSALVQAVTDGESLYPRVRVMDITVRR